MDFDRAIEIISEQLKAYEPQHFGPWWIARHCPSAYRFVTKEVRAEIGDIDWDRITIALPCEHQRKWQHGGYPMQRLSESYRNRDELDRLLAPHRPKLYTFYAVRDKEDCIVRDLIAIRLVRLAQKGNLNANKYLLSLMPGVIEQWSERNPFLGRWRFYPELLQKTISGCIVRYRYSGSFLRYLFRSLEYASYGLRPLEAFSLDELISGTDRSLAENVIHDAETQEITIYRSLGSYRI